jgi:hypothetical protein
MDHLADEMDTIYCLNHHRRNNEDKHLKQLMRHPDDVARQHLKQELPTQIKIMVVILLRLFFWFANGLRWGYGTGDEEKILPPQTSINLDIYGIKCN